MIVVAAIVFATIAGLAVFASLREELVTRGAPMNVERILHGDLDRERRNANGALHMREQLVR